MSGLRIFTRQLSELEAVFPGPLINRNCANSNTSACKQVAEKVGELKLFRIFLDHSCGLPHPPGFPVQRGETGKLHAAFLEESRTWSFYILEKVDRSKI
jgi:hypothetical protein